MILPGPCRTPLAAWTYRPKAVAAPAAGMTAWFKPETLSGLASDDAVDSWPDSSGNGYALGVPPGWGSAPSYQTGLLNGLAGVRFNDSADGHALQALFTLAQPATVFLLVARHNWGHGVNQAKLCDGGGTGTMLLQTVGTTGDYQMYAGSSGPTNNGGTAAPAPFLASCLFYGAQSTLQFDDGTVYTGNAGTSSPGGLTLASRADGVAGCFADCDIVEAIVYGRVLTADELTQTLAYFRARSGLW